MQVVSLRCSHCGGDLKIGPDVEHFACGYCGSSQIVHRDGGIVTLKTVQAAIAKVQLSTDRTAAELAIRRLKEDLEEKKLQIRKVIRDKISEQEQVGSFLAKVGIVAGAILFFGLLYYSVGMAIVCAIVVMGATVYLISEARGRIGGRYHVKLKPLYDRESQLKRRLADQIRIVEA
jgi:hypothetical protein